MGSSNRGKKAKHDRRRAHQREQKQRKETAIREAMYNGKFIGKTNKPLAKPRTGKALEEAVREEMAKRGYLPDNRNGWRRSYRLTRRDEAPLKSKS